MSSPPMYPVILNLTGLTAFVVGCDDAAVGRAQALVQHGVRSVIRFPETQPSAADFATHRPQLVFISGLSASLRDAVHHLAQQSGALVHAHDHIPLCDFHLPAILRRGRLLVTVSTDGAVAGLSRLIRDHLGGLLGEEWATRVEELAAARREWKSRGLALGALFQAIANYVSERNWLSTSASNTSK